MAQLFGAMPVPAEMEQMNQPDVANLSTRLGPEHMLPDLSPSRSARLIAKIKAREVEKEVWLPPGPGERTTPYFKFVRELRRAGLPAEQRVASEAWSKVAPEERARFAIEPPDYTQYNVQIPLSPSVTPEDGSEDSVDDEAMDCGHSLNDAEHAVDHSQRRAVQEWNRYRRDHPRACGGRPSTVPDQTFRFMDLPCELRRRVIGLLIGGRRRVAHMDANGSAGLSNLQRGVPVDVRLSAVSRAMKEEAMAVFFQDNILNIPIRLEGAFCSLPLCMRSSAKTWPLECLKRVEVDIEVDDYYGTDQLNPIVKTVCDVLSRCQQLSEVRVTPFCLRSNYSDMHDFRCEELLKIFEVVKNVSKVVFSSDEDLRVRYGSRDDRPYDDHYTIVGTETMKKHITEARMSAT